MNDTIAHIKQRLSAAGDQDFAVLVRQLEGDQRKGVQAALSSEIKRRQALRAEVERLEGLYAFQRELAHERGACCVVGLDEVGRGPIAGPLAVGAVVLPDQPRIAGLNDSKQVRPEERERIAAQIKDCALAWTVQYVDAGSIDAAGMTASLVMAFRQAIADIEAQGLPVDLVLLDGNPLRMDSREVNIVKGDARCASIAAASIVAKVERDALMVQMDEVYPGYGFASNKGYGSAEHIQAIKERGLSEIHRVSFCTAFTQETLF